MLFWFSSSQWLVFQPLGLVFFPPLKCGCSGDYVYNQPLSFFLLQSPPLENLSTSRAWNHTSVFVPTAWLSSYPEIYRIFSVKDPTIFPMAQGQHYITSLWFLLIFWTKWAYPWGERPTDHFFLYLFFWSKDGRVKVVGSLYLASRLSYNRASCQDRSMWLGWCIMGDSGICQSA